eukprot:9762865-Heterocapsa_arctica.AAC.1
MPKGMSKSRAVILMPNLFSRPSSAVRKRSSWSGLTMITALSNMRMHGRPRRVPAATSTPTAATRSETMWSSSAERA